MKKMGSMIHSSRFTAVLDTCVIYPLYQRDILFWFANYKLYSPKWSQEIFREWRRAMKRNDVSEQEIKNRMDKVNRAFSKAMVYNYKSLIDKLDLPDADDRHVMAAAIKVNANIIVINNLKQFPQDYLSDFGLSAKSPDDFLADLIDLNVERAVAAFREMVMHKKNPNLDEYEVLDRLRNNGLNKTSHYLHSQI
jgi:hypothetical protein